MISILLLVEILDVEVGIGRDEVEDVPLPTVGPVLPADVPALDQYFVESVLGCEVDVAAHVGRVGRVAGRGTAGRVVGFARTYGRNVLGVGPRLGLIGRHEAPLGKWYPGNPYGTPEGGW